jgi:large subunit ribosomal protein L18
MKSEKQRKFINRKERVKARISKNVKYPRLSVYRSNKNIFAQIVDDNTEKTLVSCSNKKLKEKAKTKTETAQLVGEELARLAKIKKITKVRFDRSGYKYHGRIKALAEGARKGGLNF